MFSKRIALLGAAVLATAAVAGGGTYALASSGTAPGVASAAVKAAVLPPGEYSATGHVVLCGNSTTLRPHTGAEASACPSGFTNKYTLNVTGKTGPAGLRGVAGATGATGPAGPAGAPGSDGHSATQSVSASTSITAWPESGLWADDSMIRAVTVTREGAADVDHCSGAPKCWLYTFTLTDGSGHFVTRDGAATPNGTGGTIHGSFTGDFSGVAVGQFYADTDQLTGSIPATATGAAKPASTTNWATLALGDGHAYGTKLTQYGWTYVNPPALCGQWVDKINPGDDGQSAADGNVTGTSVC